jgi:hypothetical protein
MGLGGDVFGRQAVKTEVGDGSQTKHYVVNPGMSPYIEFLMKQKSGLLGIGLEYQFLRAFKDDSEMKFHFMPIYGVAHVNLNTSTKLNTEFIGQIGYNYLTGNASYKDFGSLKGGPYIGAGFGIAEHKAVFQIMYKINLGSAKEEYIRRKFTNTQINISAGIRL